MTLTGFFCLPRFIHSFERVTYVIHLLSGGTYEIIVMRDGRHVILLCVGWETYEILLVGDGKFMRSLCMGMEDM